MVRKHQMSNSEGKLEIFKRTFSHFRTASFNILLNPQNSKFQNFRRLNDDGRAKLADTIRCCRRIIIQFFQSQR